MSTNTRSDPGLRDMQVRGTEERYLNNGLHDAMKYLMILRMGRNMAVLPWSESGSIFGFG